MLTVASYLGLSFYSFSITGVSVLFKQRFGGVPQLQAQKKKVGHVVHQVKDKKHIFYLVSKQRACSRPSYADLELCFVELMKSCTKFNVKTLAIPCELGDGLEVLETKYVKEILIKTFGGEISFKPFRFLVFCFFDLLFCRQVGMERLSCTDS
jgi:hypothetical protein